MQVSVIDLVHNLRINIGQLVVCLVAMLAEERDHRLEFEQHAFLVNLKVRLRFAQVVQLRDDVVARTRNYFKLKLLHLRPNFF